MTRFVFSGLVCWVLILLPAYACAAQVQELEGNSESAILGDFAIEASGPECGMHVIALNGRPESAVYRILLASTEYPSVAQKIGLSSGQLEEAVDILDVIVHSGHLTEILNIKDETAIEEDIYHFLEPKQYKNLEEFGLRIDGCVALTRNYFVNELSLEKKQIKKIKKKLLEYRRGRVMPRSRRTFAGNGVLYYPYWEASKDSIRFNQWVIEQLSVRQKEKLACILLESKNLDELCTEFHALLLSRQTPKKYP